MTSNAIDRVLRLAGLNFRFRVLMLREYRQRTEQQHGYSGENSKLPHTHKIPPNRVRKNSGGIPLLAEEGWREAPGWSVRPKRFAALTTPSAPSAHPPLLCEEGNILRTSISPLSRPASRLSRSGTRQQTPSPAFLPNPTPCGRRGSSRLHRHPVRRRS